MSPRASLPGADELFRTTGTAAAAAAGSPPDTSAARPVPLPDASVPASRHPVRRRAASTSTGRERHDEKITVYVSAAELLALEHARLSLRAEYGVAVDRGRIVREALAVVLADMEAKHGESILVRRLRRH